MNAALFIISTCSVVTLMANPDAKRLYDDLLSNYNRLIRPVSNNSDTVTVRMGLRLSQLIDLDLKNQILTTNVWVEHVWEDSKLNWDPEEYGGVTQLIVPSEHIWLPDIVLYNNADGDYVVTTMTKAILHFDGRVEWSPPAIFKSYCEIDVQYFPFDSQTCFMKFGSWSHSGYQIDLRHINQEFNRSLVEIGIDLRNYYPSVEWDILSVPAEKHNKFYPSLTEPYPDIFFNITLRRKTLFYTVNLIFPCVGISCLSVLVFYLPADSGEKVALCISILLSQTMFFLLISEIIPSTSLAVPLLGKYLLFTMFLVGLSVLITIVILNMHYRKPSTHKMAAWVRRIFIHRLPKILLMRVPKRVNEEVEQRMQFIARRRLNSHDGRRWSRRINYGSQLLCEIINFNNLPPPPSPPPPPPPPPPVPPNLREGVLRRRKRYPFELQKAIRDIHFIQNHMKRQDEYDAEDHDWNFVAMVLDRLFLWIFTLASLIGTVTILLEAPALYDPTTPIDMQISVVAQKLREDTEF